MEAASDSRIPKIQIIDTSHNTRKTPKTKNQIIAMYKLTSQYFKELQLTNNMFIQNPNLRNTCAEQFIRISNDTSS